MTKAAIAKSAIENCVIPDSGKVEGVAVALSVLRLVSAESLAPPIGLS